MASSKPEAFDGVLTDEHSSKGVERAVATKAEPIYHSRLSDNTKPSQHAKSPLSIAASPPAVTYPLDLLQTIAPASSFSSPRDFNRNPYTEIEYTPKRFRPEEYEEEAPDDNELFSSTMSSSHTWMPPDYGNELSMEQHSPTSPNLVR